MKLLSDIGRPTPPVIAWGGFAGMFPRKGARRPRQAWRGRGNFVLGGVALSLCAMMVFELGVSGAGIRDGRGGATFGTDIETNLQASAFPSEGAVRSWESVALARPLFSPSRQAPAMARNAAPQTLPRLAGIMISGNEKISIFGGADRSPVIVREGGWLGAFKVLAIAADSVRVSGPHGVESLHIDYTDPAKDGAVTMAETAGSTGANAWPLRPNVAGE